LARGLARSERVGPGTTVMGVRRVRVLLLVAGPVALLFRRRWPEATLAVAFAAAAGYAASGYPRGPAGLPATSPTMPKAGPTRCRVGGMDAVNPGPSVAPNEGVRHNDDPEDRNHLDGSSDERELSEDRHDRDTDMVRRASIAGYRLSRSRSLLVSRSSM
jgi:hypothetical protein